MSVSAHNRKARFLLGHLAEVLGYVLEQPRVPADAIIGKYFSERKYLGSRDRGFIADHLYESLRRILYYWTLLHDVLEHSPEYHPKIVVAALMVESGHEYGESSVLGDALELPASIVESIHNAITAADPDAVNYALPEWFVARIQEQYGEQSHDILSSLNVQAPITLRANRLNTTREKLLESLNGQGIPAVPGLWSPDAIILNRRMNANSIPNFKRGEFELQDEGSQLLSVMLDPHPNWRVFDACAGAGGKTLHLSAIMKGRGEVVAHDTSEKRLREIKPRIARSVAQNIRVMNHDAYRNRYSELVGAFDAVLIDAPCTGTGVLRRNPGARLTLGEDFPERMVSMQSPILDEYSTLVKPGGLLMYATCSLLREEGEDRVVQFLAEHSEFTATDTSIPEGMRTTEGYFRCYPHLHNTDGFFAAVMVRSI